MIFGSAGERPETRGPPRVAQPSACKVVSPLCLSVSVCLCLSLSVSFHLTLPALVTLCLCLSLSHFSLSDFSPRCVSLSHIFSPSVFMCSVYHARSFWDLVSFVLPFKYFPVLNPISSIINNESSIFPLKQNALLQHEFWNNG